MRRALLIVTFFLMVLSAAAQQPAVQQTNRPPTASFVATVGPRSGEGIPVDFDAGGSSDPDGQVLSYFWDFGDGALGFEPVMRHVYGQPGTYLVTLTVSDGMESAESARQVATGSTNRPPVADFTFSPAQPLTGHAVQFTSGSTDPDNDALSYSWTFGDGTRSSEANPAKVWTLAGLYDVVLSVNDGKVNGTDKVVRIAVEDPNAPPLSAFDVSTLTPAVGQSVTFTSRATDPNFDVLAHAWDFGDGTGSTAKNPVKTYATARTYEVKLTVSDGRGGSHTSSRSLAVKEANRPPVAAFTVSIVSSSSHGMVVQFDASRSSDPDGQPLLAYEWDFGDGAIPSNGSSTPQHTYAQARDYVATLRVFDGSAWSEPRSEPVTAPQNRAPVASFTFSPSQPTARQAVTFTSSSSDPDGDALTHHWSFGDGTTSTERSPVHAFPSKNMYNVVLFVSDGKANSPNHVVSVMVERGNEAPVADFTFSPAAPVAGQSITFTSTSRDGDGDPLTVLWEFGDGTSSTSNPATKTYVSAWSPTVKLTVSDGMGGTHSASKPVTITQVNRPPTADFTWQVRNATQTSLPVFFDAGKSTDPDGDALTYIWSFGDSRNTAPGSGVQAEHVYTQPGTYRVTLTVTDNRSPAVTKSWDVPVAPPVTGNRRPVAGFTWSPAEPVAGQMVAFTNTSTDEDGDALTYLWTFDDGTPPTAVKNPLKSFSAAGPHRVVLEVSDGKAGGTAALERTVTVATPSDVNHPPVANFSYSPAAPVIGQAVTFTDLSADPDGEPLTYAWNFGDGTTSTARTPVKSYGAARAYSVSLTVADSRGGSNSAFKTITVSTTAPAGPVLTFNPPSGTVVTNPAFAVTIEVAGQQLNVSTGSIRLNGVDVTATFNLPEITPTRIVATGTVQLVPGANTLVAAVSDETGRRGEATLSVTYQPEVAKPVVRFNRASATTVTDPALPLVVEATGTDLVVTTGTIHLNGVPVTTFNVPDPTPARVVAQGTVQLVPGLNTIVAAIADAAGRRGEQSLTVTYDNSAAGPANPTVTAPPNLSVTPGAQRTVKFQVRNNSTTERTFTFAATTSNAAAVSDPADPISQLIPAGATIDVPVSLSVGSGAAPGSAATVALTATDAGNTAKTGSASFAVTVALVDFQLDLSPHNGENLNAAQFGASLSYTTPAYVSMDTPRAVTLFYSSAQASPKGFVQVDVTDNSATPAEQYSILLRDRDGSAVTLTTGTTEAFYAGGVGITRLAAQFDAGALPTGAHTYTLVVRKWVAGNFSERTAPVRVLILNESGSPFGAGWSVAGLMRIHRQADGVVLTGGDGTIQFFPRGSCAGTACSFAAPRGVFVKSLVEEAERFVLTGYDGSTATFGSDGLLWRTEDRYLNRTSYDYSGGELRAITDPAGKTIAVSPAAGGFIISDPGSPSRVVSVALDGSNDLRSIVDPENVTALQADYAGHRVTNWSDGGSNRWDAGYDGFGWLSTTTAPAVTVREPSGADVQVRPVTTVLSLPTAVLAAAGRGTAAANAAARVIPAGVRTRVTDAKGNSTAMQLDRFGAVVLAEAPLGHTTVIERDEHSRVVRTTGSSGVVVENDWDPALPLLKKVTTKISATKQQVVEYTYEPRYLQPERTWGEGIEEVLHRYNNGKLFETRLAGDEARVTRYYYDARGRIKEVSDPEGHGTFYAYDAANAWMNTDSVATGMAGAPAGRLRTTTFTYDDYGRTATVTDPDGNTSSTVYDLLGRTRYAIDGNHGTTEYVHDRLFLRNVVDAERKTHTFDYNALGWLVREVDPEQRASSYRHDRNGNVVSRTNRNMQTVTFTHDALDRVLTRTADGATTSYTYDNPAGLWMTAENPLSRETLRYNAAGDLTEQVSLRNGVSYTLSSVYDPRHRREQVSLTAPFSVRSVSYGYVAEQLRTLKGLDGLTTTFHYNSDGQLESVTLPTNRPLTRSTLYASNHHATRAIYDDGNVDLSLGYWLALTKRGLIESVYDTTWKKVRNYGYDGTGQLRTVEDADVTTMAPCPADSTSFTSDGEPCGLPQLSQPTWSQTFSYDEAGNRTDSGAVHEGNRLRAFDGQTLGYDDEGNLTSRTTAAGVQTFTWNSLGQLTAVTVPGTGTYSYGYDALGRRIRRTDPGGTVTEYLYDNDDLFMELRNGAPLREYTHYPGIDRPHSVIQREGSRKDETFYYAMAEPNNVAGLIDRNNQVTNRYVYQPFGVTQTVTEGTPNPLRFMAREWDPGTSLYYVRNRWYAPDLGRFISEDPIGLEGGINPYVYAGNNPINATDPMGLTPCSTATMIMQAVAQAFGIEGIVVCVGIDDKERARRANPLSTTPSSRGPGGQAPRGGGTPSGAPAPIFGPASADTTWLQEYDYKKENKCVETTWTDHYGRRAYNRYLNHYRPQAEAGYRALRRLGRSERDAMRAARGGIGLGLMLDTATAWLGAMYASLGQCGVKDALDAGGTVKEPF
jgi:RHS repeat-associated protein